MDVDEKIHQFKIVITCALGRGSGIPQNEDQPAIIVPRERRVVFNLFNQALADRTGSLRINSFKLAQKER